MSSIYTESTKVAKVFPTEKDGTLIKQKTKYREVLPECVDSSQPLQKAAAPAGEVLKDRPVEILTDCTARPPPAASVGSTSLHNK